MNAVPERCRFILPNKFRYADGRTGPDVRCRRFSIKDGRGFCAHHHPNPTMARLLATKAELEKQLAQTDAEILAIDLRDPDKR